MTWFPPCHLNPPCTLKQPKSIFLNWKGKGMWTLRLGLGWQKCFSAFHKGLTDCCCTLLQEVTACSHLGANTPLSAGTCDPNGSPEHAQQVFSWASVSLMSPNGSDSWTLLLYDGHPALSCCISVTTSNSSGSQRRTNIVNPRSRCYGSHRLS